MKGMSAICFRARRSANVRRIGDGVVVAVVMRAAMIGVRGGWSIQCEVRTAGPDDRSRPCDLYWDGSSRLLFLLVSLLLVVALGTLGLGQIGDVQRVALGVGQVDLDVLALLEAFDEIRLAFVGHHLA